MVARVFGVVARVFLFSFLKPTQINNLQFHIADVFIRIKKARQHYSSGLLAVSCGTAEGVIKF